MTKTHETPLRNVRTCSYSLNQQRRFKAQKHVRVTAKAACLYVQTGNGNAIYRSTVLDQAKKTISASSGENFCGFKSYCGCCVGCTVYGLGNILTKFLDRHMAWRSHNFLIDPDESLASLFSFTYRISLNATPLFNRAPCSVKSHVFGGFLD